jgi:hypothetical protein
MASDTCVLKIIVNTRQVLHSREVLIRKRWNQPLLLVSYVSYLAYVEHQPFF